MDIRFIFRGLIFLLVLFFFTKFICFGPNGLQNYLQLKREVEEEQVKIKALGSKVERLKAKIKTWKKGGFVLERKARQDLQMGLCGEKVYLLV